jgi:hypothetical protein
METATLITALAALVTGAASLVIVLEMKKQRIAISRPVLKLLSKYCNAKSSGRNPWVWEDEGYRPSLNFLNFGAGPALNISIEWKLDYHELIGILKRFEPCEQLKIEQDGRFIHFGDSVHNVENQKTHKLEAMPVYSGDNKTNLNIPSYYITGFEKFIQIAFIKPPKDQDKQAKSYNVTDFPSIKAEVNYEDINGNKIKQSFKVQLQISYIGTNKEDDSSSILAVFEVSEENV